MKNMLANESSIYLQQHKSNPVFWQVWGEHAFQLARQKNCLIFISSGYSSCHWCHVMASECFADAEIADYLNDNFISIKIDREQRPDIDSFYINALQLMGEQGGWPLSMFCLPDGRPIFAGTYFPKYSTGGRIGFLPLLKNINSAWRKNEPAIKNNSEILMQHLQKLNSLSSAEQSARKNFLPFLQKLLAMQDEKNGGMKGAPKFPNAPYLDCLYFGFANYKNLSARKSFLKTIESLCLGGIYDHLAGGLARYCVDEIWLVPHFEKMLYDNANFLRHCFLAYKLTKNKLFNWRINQTINWLKSEMQTSHGGGLAASLDSNSEGVEGKYYIWQKNEIVKILGEQADEFIKLYKITEHGNFQGGNWENNNIINLLHVNFLTAKKIVNSQQEACQKLLTARKKRIAPVRDEKILSEWNGYMIEALTDCDLTFAEAIFAGVCKTNIVNGELLRCRGNNNNVRAIANDYTAMINAALYLFEKTNKQNYLQFAIVHAEYFCQNYFANDGGLLLVHKNFNELPLQLLACRDDVNDCAASQFIKLAMRLYFFTDDMKWYERAKNMLEFLLKFFGDAADDSSGQPSVYSSLEWLENSQLICLCGEGIELDAWLEVLDENLHFARVVKIIGRGEKLPSQIDSPIDYQSDKNIVAFICRGKTCSAPITDLKTFAESLNSSHP